MALRTFVKVGNITNLSDARYCAGMAVNQLGFCINPEDPSYMTPEQIHSIREWISGVEIVGEGPGNTDDLDALQLNKEQAPLNEGIPLIVTLQIKDLLVEQPWPENISYFLLDGNSSKLSETEILELKGLSQTFPIVLGYGFDKENIQEILDTVPLKGIAMKGGNEIRPGYKDYDELADILELLELQDWD